MFTGIIQEVGKIKKIIKSVASMRLTIECDTLFDDMKLGDSVSVNGTCLTVAKLSGKTFEVDVMPETYNTTSMKYCKLGSSVNLELALKLETRLGGHFVSGHVDGVGKIVNLRPQENAVYYDIQVLDVSMLKYCVLHGSIAIDGTSLTIFDLKDDDKITISLIPHTLKSTVLGFKVVGDLVNIEYDMLMKFTARLLECGANGDRGSINKLDNKFLEQCGFK